MPARRHPRGPVLSGNDRPGWTLRRGAGAGILDAMAGLGQMVATTAVIVGATTLPASAVPASAVPVQHSKGGGSGTATGIDVSYP